MGRALSLFLLALLLPKALGQSVNCDATDLVYDFSAPGSLTQVTVAGQPYYVANLASYLLLLGRHGPHALPPHGGDGGTGTGWPARCRPQTGTRSGEGRFAGRGGSSACG
jgi:hypothetical protein